MKIQNEKFELVTKVPSKRLKRFQNAVLSRNEHTLETAPSVRLNLPLKQVSLESFLAINEHSQLRNYNRTVIPRLFSRAVEKANKVSKTEAIKLRLFVKPLITHNYRQMSECETHYRCLIVYSEFDAALFDMTVSDYEKLDLIDELQKSA